MHLYYITGASRGLGKALAELCLKRGDDVIGISRTQTINHPNYRHHICDLSDGEKLSSFRLPEPSVGSYERIVLVNNAATISPVKYVGDASPEDIIKAFTLNIIAVAVLSNLFIKKFQTFVNEKLIVNITSGAANYPVDGWGTYCSAKAAMNMFTQVVAMEQEKSNLGFTTVAIAPGIVDTDMQAKIRTAETENFSRVEEFIKFKEENRLSSPEEAAGKILEVTKNLNQIQDEVISVKG